MMNKKTSELVNKIRIMEKDNDPDGYPCVKMSELSELANIIEDYDKQVKILCVDWAEDHTHLQNIIKKHYNEISGTHSDVGIGTYEELIYGTYSMPGIQELADTIYRMSKNDNISK